ncbi:LytR/AlgR family response regulator transcription factor [Idiomarina xiamenensis]|uniref:LytTR family two component transcriptional regulator n=1 Tax=Idiomarina xiamenensis 10-D-4 TaxID=740709 RepID=K2KHE5_9GAMM|nr:LytTR family DNA-binding domain-containing protein [Idiomarina xiamenensis]EKE82089.1 LytTR family two component transcriptional regulator [Idiomarina xiamenensis 10-D-4]
MAGFYGALLLSPKNEMFASFRAALRCQTTWCLLAREDNLDSFVEKSQQLRPHCCVIDTAVVAHDISYVFSLIERLPTQLFYIAGEFDRQQSCYVGPGKALLLPSSVDAEVWVDVLQDASAWLEWSQQNVSLSKNYQQLLPVKSVGKIRLVPTDDIMWIKGAANYVELHTKEAMLLHRDSMSSLEAQLNPQRFIRVHRSAIVNIKYVTEISSELGRYTLLELSDGTEIKIGNAYRKSLFSQLGLEAQA